MRDTILIVDDLEVNRLILREILCEDYDIIEAASGQECLEILETVDKLPSAVLLDILMPGMDGFEVLSQMKHHWRVRNIPVLIVTNVNAADNESFGLKMGAHDYISRPFNPDVVKARVDNCMQLFHYRSHLEQLVDRKTAEVTETHERIMEVMATLIEYRSDESSSHIRRTSALCSCLVEFLAKHPRYEEQLMQNDSGAMIRAMSLHDIGKVAIPDHILLKPGRLTNDEFEIVKRHAVIGARIIESVCLNLNERTEYLRHCMEICRSHHERWDGTGYPDGLRGEDIPLSARILSVVDVFDALASPRCYKPAFSYEECFRIINEGWGAQFDPSIVDALMAVKDDFVRIHSEMADVAEEAMVR